MGMSVAQLKGNAKTYQYINDTQRVNQCLLQRWEPGSYGSVPWLMSEYYISVLCSRELYRVSHFVGYRIGKLI